MLLVHLTLLQFVACLDVQVEGDLAFNLQVPNRASGRGRWLRLGLEAGSQVQELVVRVRQMENNVTVARKVECIYRYPEKKQVDALLSNMMNELTKVFVRANEYMIGLETRRYENRLTKSRRENFAVDVILVMRGTANTEPPKEDAKGPPLRNHTRFRVVDKKQKQFFERVYNNMTDEYRTFYNATNERVDRSERDACNHQVEVKQLWHDLLQHAQVTLSRAAQRCVDEYFKDKPVEQEQQMRERLKQYLETEVGKVHAGHLDMLCDTYQLCYYDLLP